MSKTVLVTGGTGFIGGWTIVDLLKRGYSVRTAVRSLGLHGEPIGTNDAHHDPPGRRPRAGSQLCGKLPFCRIGQASAERKPASVSPPGLLRRGRPRRGGSAPSRHDCA